MESRDLNTLRKIIRDLEEENHNLKSLLSDKGIAYESTSVFYEDVFNRDVYDAWTNEAQIYRETAS